MKKLLLALALCLFFPTIASAQCNGVFGASTICGRDNSSSGPPKQVPFSTAFGTQYVQCTNTSADVTNLNTALAKGGEVRPIGTCLVGASGGSAVSFTASNTWLHGFGAGSTILKVQPASSYSGCVVQAIGAPTLTDIRLSDFTFDGSDAGTGLAPPNGTMLCSQAVTGISYDHIEVLRMYGTFAMSVQGDTNFNISNNTITLTTARTTQNQCILGTAALQNLNGYIKDNICVGSAIEYDGTNIVVSGNEVSGWKFGGGITTGPCSGCGIIDGHNTIANNILHDSGLLPDTNNTIPLGIEDWGPFDTVTGNVTYRNGGIGINAGGANSVYSGNIGWDNGQGSPLPGLLVQFSASAACNNCIVSGNSFFNTNGVAGTQTYGIGFNQAVTGAIIASDNYAGPGNLGTIGPTNAGSFSTGVIANNMPFQAFNGSGTPTEILRYNTNNQTQVGGPLGGGGQVIVPQQLCVFGVSAANCAIANAFVVGGGGANAVAQLVSPTSGTGQGAGLEISVGPSSSNLSLYAGGYSGLVGGTFNSDPLFYTNDFVTTGAKMHWIFQTISASGDAFTMSPTGLNAQSTLVYSWNGDTGFSRTGAAQIGVGNGTTGNTGGTLLASQFVASGNALWALDVNAFAGLKLASGSGVSWSSTTNWFGTLDTGLTRDSAGVVDVGNGSAANKSGSLNATNTTLTGTATAKRVTGNTNSVPTNNACTGFALATGSSDLAGKVTFTSATSCNINFGSAFTNAPFCTVSPGSAASTVLVSTTTTVLSVTFGTANTAMYYICAGA